MKVLFACVCDHATADASGKLAVTGIFDKIMSPMFPARHQKMFLVFRLCLEYEDNEKKNQLAINLYDADRRSLLTLEAEIEHQRNLPGDFTTLNQLIELNDLVLANPGRYTFVLKADGVVAAEVPLAVEQQPQGA